MANYLITGANRGIGLAMARVLAGRGDRVIGTARDPAAAAELAGIGAQVIALDVADEASAAEMARRLGDQPVDVLVNNAGVFNDKSALESLDLGKLVETMRVNVAGPLAVTRALLDHLTHGSRRLVVNISSVMGSIERTTSGGSYGYRASKAALNMVTRVMAADLAQRKIAAVTVHPGWVQTDMGGPGAHLKPDESARHLVATIDALELSDSGRFMDFRGEPLPW
jgi:NAD(P)-dependent dehydrogenase (short-subunit alcohol dehydrogenase family)